MGKATVKERLPFYRYDKILSFNALWMFIIGVRGNGKTFGAKKKAVNDALHRGRQFIYVRRFRDEIIKAKDAFFDDLIAEGLYDGWEFRVNGYVAEAARRMTPEQLEDRKFRQEWETIGFFVALSQGQTYKSVPFPNVHWILFDEFILEKSGQHYLANEAALFQNFYSTVDRWKDQVRVIFMANTVSVNNPYFLEWDIVPDESDEYTLKYRDSNGRPMIAVHFIDADEFSGAVYKTRFGQFIRDSEYGKFAAEAQFNDGGMELVRGKGSDAKYRFTLDTDNGIFSIWYSPKESVYFAQKQRPGNELIWTMNPSHMQEGWKLMQYSDRLAGILRGAFSAGNIYFDTAQTRNAFVQIYKR